MSGQADNQNQEYSDDKMAHIIAGALFEFLQANADKSREDENELTTKRTGK